MPYSDPEIKKEYQRKYRLQHIKNIAGYQRKYRERHPEKERERQTKFRKKQKDRKIKWLLEFLGSDRVWCDRCKYDRCFSAIHVHHIDKLQKEHHLDSLSLWLKSYPLNKFQDKILNTRLLFLCANCHAELHAGIWKYE